MLGVVPLVVLLVLYPLHVVIHVHESTQPGSVEGSITARWVHAHLLLIAIPSFEMNASCLRLCVEVVCVCLQMLIWVILVLGGLV